MTGPSRNLKFKAIALPEDPAAGLALKTRLLGPRLGFTEMRSPQSKALVQVLFHGKDLGLYTTAAISGENFAVLINWCTAADPEDRPIASEILASDYARARIDDPRYRMDPTGDLNPRVYWQSFDTDRAAG
ncbi:hypothetical protein HDU93_010003 [Gonapodya sp. JEL0774]|nr:hypothetical protein HDU93_010003 [Gonapodya sp. JEL0774]